MKGGFLKLGLAHAAFLFVVALVCAVFAFVSETVWRQQSFAREFFFVFFWFSWVVFIPLFSVITFVSWIICKIRGKTFSLPGKIAFFAGFPLEFFAFVMYCAFF